MKRYLIDASIVLKSLLTENDLAAERFNFILRSSDAGKTEVISQPLLITEVANGIRFSEKNSEAGVNYFKAFLKLPIKYHKPSKTLHNKILELSYMLGTTVYDTSYHVFAKVHNATFLTCDEDYYQKARQIGHIELVR